MKSASGKGGGPARGTTAPPLEVTFPSSPEYLPFLRATTRWFAKKSRFSDRDAHRIVLAAVEATTNIIRHAYGMDPSQRITLRMAEIPGGVELEFLDDGRHAPLGLPEKPCVDERRPGGLGVGLMKKCIDTFCYEPRPGGGSRLVLRKLRDADEECGCP